MIQGYLRVLCDELDIPDAQKCVVLKANRSIPFYLILSALHVPDDKLHFSFPPLPFQLVNFNTFLQ